MWHPAPSLSRNARSASAAILVSVVHGPQNFKHLAVVDPCLDAQDPLPDGGQELVGRERPHVARSRAETVEPRLRQDNGLVLAFLQLAEARVHIAANVFNFEIRTNATKLRGAAQRAGSNAGVLRQVRQ